LIDIGFWHRLLAHVICGIRGTIKDALGVMLNVRVHGTRDKQEMQKTPQVI
jgi:hypothetical protein